jgi:hypothetical protein
MLDANLGSLHRALDSLKELGVVLFCLACAALVLIEVLIPKFFQVLSVFQQERHAYNVLKSELGVGRKRELT